MEFIDEVRDILSDLGIRPMVHTADCVMWKAEHDNCIGCEHELGCAKYISFLLVLIDPYEPKNYADHVANQERSSDLTQKILSATSLEELKSIPLV